MLGMNPADYDGASIVEVEVPKAEVQRYATDLRSITQGRRPVHQRIRALSGSAAARAGSPRGRGGRRERLARQVDDAGREFLQRLIDAPSPSGYEQAARRVWHETVADYADEVRGDVHGNVIATRNSGGNPQADVRWALRRAGPASQLHLGPGIPLLQHHRRARPESDLGTAP